MPRFAARSLPLLPVAVLLCSGCVTFEKEHMVFVFPPNSPEVRGLLIYEGLRVSGDTRDSLETAKTQMKRFVEGGQEFCLGDNWILHFNLADDKDDNFTAKMLKAALRKNVVVHNRAFFFNAEGKLCGYQMVTVKDGAALAADLNRLTSAAVVVMAAEAIAKPKDRPKWLDDESLRRLKKAAAENYAWFQVEPGRVSFGGPVSASAAAYYKQEVITQFQSGHGLEHLLNRLTAENEAKPDLPAVEKELGRLRREQQAAARALAGIPWSLEHRHDRFGVSLGLGNGEPIRMTVPNAEPIAPRPLDKEFLAFARELKATFAENGGAEQLIAQFLKDHERLPADKPK